MMYINLIKHYLYSKIPNKDVVRLIDKQFNFLDVQLLNNVIADTSLGPDLNWICVMHGNLNLLKELPIPNKNRLLISSIIRGNIDIAEYLISEGADVTADDNYAVRYASTNGHTHVVKYLVSKGADVTALDNYVFRWTSRNGHLETVKYLVSVIACITPEDMEYAVRWASENDHLEIVKYLESIGV